MTKLFEREEPVVRGGRSWTSDISSLLPWCFWDELSMSGWTPHGRMIAWASDLRWERVHEQGINLLEPLPINPSSYLRPHVCYHMTVIFYLPNTASEMARCDLTPRTWPQISFIAREGMFYEVIGGGVVHVFDRWQFEWRARKNTELARHFNQRCEDCRFCRLLAPKAAA